METIEYYQNEITQTQQRISELQEQMCAIDERLREENRLLNDSQWHLARVAAREGDANRFSAQRRASAQRGRR